MLTTLFFAQTVFGQSGPLKAPPIRLDAISKEKLTVPTDISVLGAKYYELRVAPTGQIAVKLFDAKQTQIALIEIEENFAERQTILKYSDKNGKDWISSSMSRLDGEVFYTATSSGGGEVRVRARMYEAKSAEKLRVSSLIFETEIGLREFRFDALDFTESRLNAQHQLQAQEAKLYGTPGLLKLREFIQNFARLSDNALRKSTGQPEFKGCTGVTQSSVEEIEAAGCSGQAICTRIGTAIPIFMCNGGSSCSGVYIIYDFMFRIITMADCSYLNGCVSA